ncbi:MAG: M18 family aminopeptidase [Erysipelotrichales bacterium]|nr:M18 family aminopeptidase [Erysipelotrichales bacterium]
MNHANKLLQFLNDSKSAYHAVYEISKRLEEAGYTQLVDSKKWEITKGGKYYTTKGGSSIIAFNVGECVEDLSLQIVASHSDSPTFKIKPNADYPNSKYMKLNVEQYGGVVLSTWLDKPLSIAGRAIIKKENMVVSELVDFGPNYCLIPNMPPHINREINSGFKYNVQTDLLPLLGSKKEGVTFKKLLAEKVGCEEKNVLGQDLFLYPSVEGVIWGSDSEYIGCPRIDNLECAYTSLTGFINAGCTNGNLNVYACFDNEEVGSGTKQGAASTFLYDTVQRAITSLGLTQEDYLRAVANGMIVSADNAHALHPNHGELFDAQNHAYMNEGIAIKHNAAQSYTTEGVSNAVFQDICASVNVPTQYFTNRSDLRGGGTLGSISSTQVSILSVDIGLPQLAMHSSFECAGVKDVEYMIQALTAFYSAHISKVDDTHYQIQY